MTADGEETFGSGFTRRGILAGAAALAATQATRSALAQQGARPDPKTSAQGGGILAWVGTYTPNGEGIHLFRMDPATGALTSVKAFGGITNPSWLALAPDGKTLYAVSEVDDFKGTGNGAVVAYTVDHAGGDLTEIGRVDSRGATPAHLSVHPSGKFVFVANYGGGTVAVLPVKEGGGLGDAVDVATDEGPRNPARADDNPPGNFAPSDHAGPHMHMVAADPTGRFVVAADAGLDRILVWKLDPQSGKLAPADTPFVAVKPGSAPRHFVFHPDGKHFFCVLEQDSMIQSFGYDGRTGALTARQTVSMLPKGYAGSNLGSELAITPDGRFLYAGNRLHDTIAIFAVDGDGRVTPRGEEWVRADYPRSFALDPTGTFLFSCNQRGDSITAFRRDAKTGGLHFTEKYTPVGSPAAIAFLR